MRAQITFAWNKISRIGLNKDEGVHTNRQVIFLNRMLALLPVILAFYIPVEIYFNGAATIHVIVIMALLFLVPLPLHHFRLFRLAHYYIFLIGNLAITYAGILVGKGVNNHVTLIPIVLIAIILFQTKIERIIALLISIAFFAAQNYFLDVIPPTTIINTENKTIFSFVFFILAMVMSFLVGFYFIGINNPLIIIRNNEIIEIKPDKQPVGKYSGAKNFTNHLIQLQKGDLLYIFSDGYSDQFGGENGKKLKYKTFKQLLLKHHTKTMAIQKTELNTAIELWKGGLEQVDDICIIGLRI